ncbi:hypothetical protein [Pseudoduganella violaceinigra]|uniref:hypothetical protein n=1 Tax=Pseudoduganella violaceinigra TaxID=246602 RepID=UPI000401B878|nr:hypothetical protein [Pseudoduganella violaceinigra]
MAEPQIKAWTISAGAVGKKIVKRSYGGVHAAMNISTSRRHTTVSWHAEPLSGKGRTVWHGVVSTLVGAD